MPINFLLVKQCIPFFVVNFFDQFASNLTDILFIYPT